LSGGDKVVGTNLVNVELEVLFKVVINGSVVFDVLLSLCNSCSVVVGAISDWTVVVFDVLLSLCNSCSVVVGVVSDWTVVVLYVDSTVMIVFVGVGVASYKLLALVGVRFPTGTQNVLPKFTNISNAIAVFDCFDFMLSILFFL